MAESLLFAFGLLLVLEGILPFLAPAVWRRTFERMTRLADGQLRFFGLTSMIIGLFLIIFFK